MIQFAGSQVFDDAGCDTSCPFTGQYKGASVTESRIRYLSEGHHIPFFRTPDLNSEAHPWAGFSFEESKGSNERLPCHAWSKTTLLYVNEFKGQSSLRWKHRGVWNLDSIENGTVSIVRRDVEIQAAVPSSAVPMMVLQLDNARLQHLAPEQLLSIDKSLVPVQLTKDHRFAELLSAMRDEVRNGCLSGRLYAEALSISLLSYLAANYSSHACSTATAGTFSIAQKRIIKRYTQENLVENISVKDLADLVLMSPSHFSRVFKTSFGETPYRFVMRQRIEAAKEMLSSSVLTCTHVASALGFASQSHFLKVFRQFTGVTPRQFQMSV